MLVLVRGLPGSGKSTLARGLRDYAAFSHRETDKFFERVDGTYDFNPKLLSTAHAWCQRRAEKSLIFHVNCVVSNTFTQLWEIQPYLDMAAQYEEPVVVVKCVGEYGSIHNVPATISEKMKARWEDYPGEISYDGDFNTFVEKLKAVEIAHG